MKPVHRQLLALLLAVVLGSALCLSLYVWDNKYTRPGAQPMDGLLTLTDEELGQTDLHFLIHGWAFYPGVLLTPEEWTAHGTEHYMIYTSIGERTRFDQPDGVTPHGCGTYVLTLELTEDPAQYGLELPEIYSAYRLYLNGNLELQVGEPDLKHYQPRTQNRMVTFTGSGLTTILLAVRDDSHFYSGLVYPCRFLREGILAGNERQAGTGIPFHSNLPHIVHIGNRSFCTGQWGLRIVHGTQGDAGSSRVLLADICHLFFGRNSVQSIISFADFPGFGIAFSFVPVLAVPCAAVLPAVLPAGAVPSQWSGFRYSGTAWRYGAAF